MIFYKGDADEFVSMCCLVMILSINGSECWYLNNSDRLIVTVDLFLVILEGLFVSGVRHFITALLSYPSRLRCVLKFVCVLHA